MSKPGVSSRRAEQAAPVSLRERGAPMQPETSVKCCTGGIGGGRAWVGSPKGPQSCVDPTAIPGSRGGMGAVRGSNGGLGSHASGAAAAEPQA